MEIEKTLQLHAIPEKVWSLLLNPQEMAACVPGMESVEVLTPDEYLAVMKVKISFISARFKLKTTIVERNEPHYLRAEGTGEDASVFSSLKQVSEMWLTPKDGGTELRLKVAVDVLGRLGSFGLGVMKTKADRLWDEFGANVNARLTSGEALAGVAQTAVPASSTVSDPVSAAAPAPAPLAASASAPTVRPVVEVPAAAQEPLTKAATAVTAAVPAAGVMPLAPRGWWSRLVGGNDRIDIDFQKGDLRVRASWPANAAAECAAWLRTLH